MSSKAKQKKKSSTIKISRIKSQKVKSLKEKSSMKKYLLKDKTLISKITFLARGTSSLLKKFKATSKTEKLAKAEKITKILKQSKIEKTSKTDKITKSGKLIKDSKISKEKLTTKFEITKNEKNDKSTPKDKITKNSLSLEGFQISKVNIQSVLSGLKAIKKEEVKKKSPYLVEVNKKSDREILKTPKGIHSPKDPIARQSSERLDLKKALKLSRITVKLTDVCVLFIYCRTHKKVLITRQDGIIFMPFVELPVRGCWEYAALSEILNLLQYDATGESLESLKKNPIYDQFRIVDVLRLQQPQTHKFLTRIIYQVSLKPEVRVIQDGQEELLFQCCGELGSCLEWMPLEQLAAGISPRGLLGTELITLVMHLKKNWESNRLPQAVYEFTIDDAKQYIPKTDPRLSLEEQWRALNIGEKDIERLYADYMEHCFPSFYMTGDSFMWYMRKYSFEKRDACLTRFFKAFMFKKRGYVCFEEFAAGLFCMEPYSQHNELRVKFIFRYYDSDMNGTLNRTELRRLLADIFIKKKADLDKEVDNALSAMKHSTNEKTGEPEVTCQEFVAAVGRLIFRGTSALCRSSRRVFSQIASIYAMTHMNDSLATREACGMIVQKRDFNAVCSTCKARDYQLSRFVSRLYLDGNIESRQLEEQPEESAQPEAKKENPNWINPRYSIEHVFNRVSAANLTLGLVRDFNAIRGTTMNPSGLLADQPSNMYTLLCALYEDLQWLLDREKKCTKTLSPCFVIGDIHGNLEDLLSLEKALWKNIPLVTTSFVFCGDYVDRGQWGFECSLYLFAFKILCPNKVILCRGNHEVRLLQTHYTYKQECLNKYGEEWGLKMWELTNRIFDKLPVAAVIDDAIFCAHGGIPKSADTIEQIAEVDKELKDPESDSAIVWEILWSDPAHQGQFEDAVKITGEEEEVVNMGFVRNTKRGTAFMFNEIGLNRFLNANKLSHVIRAHEVPVPGYNVPSWLEMHHNILLFPLLW